MITLNIDQKKYQTINLNYIHTKIQQHIAELGIFTDDIDELLTAVHIELLKIIGRYSEDYQPVVVVDPEVYQQIHRQGNNIVISVNSRNFVISLDIDLTQQWKSIPWNHTNEYNLNDEPVLPQVPEEKEGGYIFIGNRLWSRETFLKFFIPA